MRWPKKDYLKKLWLENFQFDLKPITKIQKVKKKKTKARKIYKTISRNMVIKLLEIINKDKIAKAVWGKKNLFCTKEREKIIQYFSSEIIQDIRKCYILRHW